MPNFNTMAMEPLGDIAGTALVADRLLHDDHGHAGRHGDQPGLRRHGARSVPASSSSACSPLLPCSSPSAPAVPAAPPRPAAGRRTRRPLSGRAGKDPLSISPHKGRGGCGLPADGSRADKALPPPSPAKRGRVGEGRSGYDCRGKWAPSPALPHKGREQASAFIGVVHRRLSPPLSRDRAGGGVGRGASAMIVVRQPHSQLSPTRGRAGLGLQRCRAQAFQSSPSRVRGTVGEGLAPCRHPCGPRPGSNRKGAAACRFSSIRIGPAAGGSARWTQSVRSQSRQLVPIRAASPPASSA